METDFQTDKWTLSALGAPCGRQEFGTQRPGGRAGCLLLTTTSSLPMCRCGGAGAEGEVGVIRADRRAPAPRVPRVVSGAASHATALPFKPGFGLF